MFMTDISMGVVDLALEAEERGFHSLWLPEHTHAPVSRRTLPTGSEVPPEYGRLHDPFVALSFAAASTTRLRVGTAICLVAQRDPVILAKEIATLDHLSGGRFNLGVGYGWSGSEMRQHGVDPRTRKAVLRENVLAMRAIWESDVATYRGEFVEMAPLTSWPKPVQRPHPPLLLGAEASLPAFRDIAEFADGWMPVCRADNPSSESISLLRRAFEEAGRDPATVILHVTNVPIEQAHLDRLQALGVDGLSFFLPSLPRDHLLPLIESATALLPPQTDPTIGLARQAELR